MSGLTPVPTPTQILDYLEMRLPGTVEILEVPGTEVTTEPPGLS